VTSLGAAAATAFNEQLPQVLQKERPPRVACAPRELSELRFVLQQIRVLAPVGSKIASLAAEGLATSDALSEVLDGR
jgi:hypothetical protein